MRLIFKLIKLIEFALQETKKKENGQKQYNDSILIYRGLA